MRPMPWPAGRHEPRRARRRWPGRARGAQRGSAGEGQMVKPTVLVTGGAGYIGSHACKALGRAGYQPIVFDNLRYGHAWAVKWGPLVEGDILDRARLDEVFATYAPEAVIHFAAYAYVGE